ncbi:1963_t:CDS:2, partial [Acaulospora colombiana]
MVKTYDKWGPTQAFGLICSAASCSVYDGKLAFVPALEDVLVWDVKKGQMLAMWHETGHRAEVTSIVQSPLKTTFAVGLRGHRDQITGMRFITTGSTADQASSSRTPRGASCLVTCSKDTFLKLWDLTTQHCIQTIVAHRSDVWSLDVDPSGNILLTGSGEGEVKAWKIDKDALEAGVKELSPGEIEFHPTSPYLAIQSQDRSIDVFRIRTEEEIRKKQARRQKRAKEKKAQKADVDGNVDGEDGVSNELPADSEIELVDLYTPYLVIRASGKIRSFSFVAHDTHPKGAQIFTALSNNALEVYNIPNPVKSKDAPEATRLHALDLPGHRTDIRTVAISADEQLVATASNGQMKVWNMKTLACIRTFECGYAISNSFLPGDRQNGEMVLYDIGAASTLQTIEAHSSTLWSLHVRPDFGGLITGSADKDVKFWDIVEKADAENPSRKHPELVHTRTLKMSDEVLAVKYSPNNRFIAVALLDATVKIFYQDTLKFFLSLYGHK